MSAQYRPYRDEDSVDGVEVATWSDNEPGSIHIYEKTTEELPFNPDGKRVLWIQIALFTITGLLGFSLGYFGPFHQSDISSCLEESERLASEQFDLFEDPTIKDKLLNQIDARNILELMKAYDNTNRIPGSEKDHEFAQKIYHSFSAFGLDPVTATNFTFETMLPKKASVVKLLNKKNETLYSNIENEHYPHDDMRPFLPLSQAEGKFLTTDQILYVNKGLKEDYLKLQSLGLNPSEKEGKVLVIRQSFYKALNVVIDAQKTGAKAVLLFPDPDIYGSSSPFPTSIQLPNDAGKSHPLVWNSYGDLGFSNFSSFNDIDISELGLEKEVKVLIPVIPISFNAASKILRGLAGVEAPKDWNCFDFTLYLGPGYKDKNNEDERDKISIEFHNHETTITSTTITGVIVGAIEPDRYIVFGSRRDSLNRGILDSISGTAIMLEVARVYGNLLKQGWRPRRTIVFSSFGSESLNLIGSSKWLESHHRLLHSRAVAYINCDLVVTGNKSAAIAASPLLYQVLFNATKQVLNPNSDSNPHLATVYDAWKDAHHFNKSDEIIDKLAHATYLTDIFDDSEHLVESKLTKSQQEDSDGNSEEDSFGSIGNILREYKKSAMVKTRPKVRRLDLQSIYSPFFHYSGIPVVDVRYAGIISNNNQSIKKPDDILEDFLPIIGTKYDNLAAVQHVDPHLKYHVAVAQILSEILRDLSDSLYLPFNLLDYAVTMRDSYVHFVAHYGKNIEVSRLELDSLKQVIVEFWNAAIQFHHRQDQVRIRDVMKIRKFNDQLMLLERTFLDLTGLSDNWGKHIILTPNDGQDHKGGFPGLVDWISLLEGDKLDPNYYAVFLEVLKLHYKTVINTISDAIKIIEEVHML